MFDEARDGVTNRESGKQLSYLYQVDKGNTEVFCKAAGIPFVKEVRDGDKSAQVYLESGEYGDISIQSENQGTEHRADQVSITVRPEWFKDFFTQEDVDPDQFIDLLSCLDQDLGQHYKFEPQLRNVMAIFKQNEPYLVSGGLEALPKEESIAVIQAMDAVDSALESFEQHVRSFAQFAPELGAKMQTFTEYVEPMEEMAWHTRPDLKQLVSMLDAKVKAIQEHRVELRNQVLTPLQLNELDELIINQQKLGKQRSKIVEDIRTEVIESHKDNEHLESVYDAISYFDGIVAKLDSYEDILQIAEEFFASEQMTQLLGSTSESGQGESVSSSTQKIIDITERLQSIKAMLTQKAA